MHQTPFRLYMIGYERERYPEGWTEEVSGPLNESGAADFYRMVVQQRQFRKPIVFSYEAAGVVHRFQLPWTNEIGELK